MKKLFFILFILFTTVVIAQNKQTPFYKEAFRPQFHFTPPVHWTNDPNGLVYYNGDYHLFYQYNPFGIRWGHMTWGHATSKDLFHWQHQPVAIPEENNIMIFSGSAVIDENNSSGFAKQKSDVPMVAIYTGHLIPDAKNPDDYTQAQYIAYSLDKGQTWTKYDKNPVLDLGTKDFRDPKVFWYAPGKKWVMGVVKPHEHVMQLYSSANLKEWKHMSDFGPAGDTTEIWECPDLLEVPIKDQPGKNKWVMINSKQYSMQYFVGEFDGTTFKADNSTGKIHQPDYGPDYYAAVTYNHLPKGQKPVLLGWASNWKYANDIPTNPWRSAMALPRSLQVKKINNEWVLLQQPVETINQLRMSPYLTKNIILNGDQALPVKSQTVELELVIQPAAKSTSGIKLAVGNGKFFEIGYDADKRILYLDRRNAGRDDFNKSFPQNARYETALPVNNGLIKLHVFFDKSIIEIFANEGEVAMTAQLFPDEKNDGISLFSRGGKSIFKTISVWKLKSAW